MVERSRRRSRPLIALATVAFVIPGQARAEASVTFSHDDWSAVLSRFVDDAGRVDYRALAGSRRDLDRYLEQIAMIGPQSTPARFPTADDQLAYYINAYNALVFDGVLNGYVDADSVWSGLISGYSFFVGRKHRLDGRRINLRNLENKIIRKRFGDARIHAALNCASAGCPRLPRKAFDPRHLQTELEAAMTGFVSEERNVRVDAPNRTVHLSKIFDWFTDDFLADERTAGTADPDLIDYVNRFRKNDVTIPRDYAVRFMEYDKRLNRQPESQASAGP